MRVIAPLLAALAALGFAAVPAQSADVGNCVNYAFVHDYQWHYLCVEPKDADCPVYTAVSNGYDMTKTWCATDVVPDAAVQAPPRCVFLAQDLDYAHYACYDAGDLSCPVYLKRVSGGHETRTCL